MSEQPRTDLPPEIDLSAVSAPRPPDYVGLEIIPTPQLQRLHRRLRAAAWWCRLVTAWMTRRPWYTGEAVYGHLREAAGHIEQAATRVERNLRDRVEAERRRHATPPYADMVERTPETDEWLKS